MTTVLTLDKIFTQAELHRDVAGFLMNKRRDLKEILNQLKANSGDADAIFQVENEIFRVNQNIDYEIDLARKIDANAIVGALVTVDMDNAIAEIDDAVAKVEKAVEQLQDVGRGLQYVAEFINIGGAMLGVLTGGSALASIATFVGAIDSFFADDF